jgi:type IV secretion system protein VirD4
MKPTTRKILEGVWHYVGRWVAWVIWCLGVAGTFMEPSASIRRSNTYIFGGIAAVYLLYRMFHKKPPVQRPVSTVYGTARYAPLQADITDAACLAKGLFFGKSSEPGRDATAPGAPGAPVCSTPEHHTLIVARTRTGKGTRVIVPTLLRYGGSALVIDPKGENAAITAMVRKVQLGQSIHILNPWNELAGTYDERGFKPATYNPLDILDRDDPNVVAIAQTLAGAICPAPANAKDRFWQGSAANVLTAVFLWLTDRQDERKTLARAREIVSLTRKEFTTKYLTQMAASEAFSNAIREMAAPMIDLADETYSGVMSNLSESTKFLSDPQIKAATAQSSFSMEDLATKKATVYVVIPTERMDTQKTWLRIVIAAGMHIFKNPRAKLQHGHRCLFLIDEFAALGRLDDLPRDIATMSGFGVDFALIVQGLDQLKDHYAEARGTILSNCAYKWFCNVNDLDSAKYLSDTLGKKTVRTVSMSATLGGSRSGHGASSSSSQTVSQSETGRSLLNPDEVLNLGRNVAIGIQPNGNPHYLTPVDYWNLGEAFAALRKKHPTLYWEPPVLYDENPYFAPPPPDESESAQEKRGMGRFWRRAEG